MLIGLKPRFGLITLVIIASIFALQIVVGYVVFRQIYLSQIKSTIEETINFVQKDAIYKDGKWDLSLYNSDPRIPSPNSPMYVFTTDGFVIERNRTIVGFLDASDISYLQQYLSAQTVVSPTNESWRLIAKNIEDENGIEAAVMVGYYNPKQEVIGQIDEQLNNDLVDIASKVILRDGTVDVSAVDVKDVPFDVSFAIVSRYNRVLVRNGRIPAFIDRSYIESLLSNTGYQVTEDNKTGEKFLVSTQSLSGDDGKTYGVIVAGRSIKTLTAILQKYLIVFAFFNRLLILPVSLLLELFIKKEIIKKSAAANSSFVENINKLSFDKKSSQIMVGSNSIKIPYSSNQFYLCDAIFSSPNKRWESDELLEKFGDDTFGKKNRRKVYDAMLSLNKKVSFNLVLYQNKTYQLNPKLAKKLI